MILKFKFDYNSNNNTLIYFLHTIAKQSNLEYKVTKSNFINLFINGNEDELTKFSTTLSSSLPMSIFFKDSTAEVVSQMSDEQSIGFDNEKINLPFCSSCLEKVEDNTSKNFYNPFVSCDICGTTCDVNELSFLDFNKQQIHYENYEELFKKIAFLLNDEKSIKIKTRSGSFVFKKLMKTEENVKLLCTNLANISKVFIANKAEVVALASIEKPIINLRVNEVFKLTNTLNQEYANVRFVNDLILYLLAKELKNYDIDFLIYDETSKFDYELTYEKQLEALDIMKIKIIDDKNIILESNSYNKVLDDIYSKFIEPSKSHFMVLLHEYNFYNKSILNFYSSTKEDDNIALYSKDIEGLLDIVSYKLPNSIEEIFETLKKDETASKLLENYKNKYSDIYENAKNCDISSLKTNSIYSYWKIISVILGFTSKIEEDNVLLNNATACVLDKGPRIDYKLKESDKIFNKEFLLHKLIQSGMSFKLAGVDDKTLSLGYVESFAHYISTLIDDIHSEVKLDGISFTGNLFSNELISKLVHKSITKNFKIYYNKDFVIQK
ncbi:hypothetical protein [Malaciobacter marinus]|uniref:hypothetical protein n=1 Tax=Malaciobacter marinus TaxID=505249 RepID=UPI003AFF8B6A